MNYLLRVLTQSLDEVAADEYDLSIVVAGYERRGRHILEVLGRRGTGQLVALAYRDAHGDEVRTDMERLVTAVGGETWIADAGSPDAIYELLRRQAWPKDRPARLLVDYSSMSRVWYAAILNWARWAGPQSGVEVSFVYAVGDHPTKPVPRQVTGFARIPGFEGLATTRPSVLFVGLGFDRWIPYWLLSRLEPEIIVAHVADPGGIGDYGTTALDVNADFLAETDAAVLMLPLEDCGAAFRTLGEALLPYLGNANLAFASIGPKPHVLVSLLLSCRFPELLSFRVSTSLRPLESRVPALGPVIGAKVTFGSVDRLDGWWMNRRELGLVPGLR